MFRLGTTVAVLLLLPLACLANDARDESHNWQKVIRESPHWTSQGMFKNLLTIRRWVLNSESFCEVKARHILFDRRATFLGYVPNAEDVTTTQVRLNEQRKALADSGRVGTWLPGEPGQAGYPFALDCNQPDAQLALAMARYQGVDDSARLWGTWDGMAIGTKDSEVSLHKAIGLVYEDRRRRGRVSLPPEVLSLLAGKALIESAGQKAAHSAANARGIMQLSEPALKDCGLSERFYFHRLAQIDCAMRLLEQNHRNLEPVYAAIFGHLPREKADLLYSMLLIQAYHGGVGRISALLDEPGISEAALYFAKHHERFSAGDIALGLIFHNLGRNQLGFASLYYVTDIAIATQVACQAIQELPGCEKGLGDTF